MWVAKAVGSTPKLRFWYTVCNFYTNVSSGRVNHILAEKNILSGTRHETSRSDTGLLTKTGFESSAEPSPDLHKNRYSFTILTIRVVCNAWTICTACVQLSFAIMIHRRIRSNSVIWDQICTARVQWLFNLYSPCTVVVQSVQPVYSGCTMCTARAQ